MRELCGLLPLSADKNEEAENVISAYLFLPEIREIRLKELLSEKQYEQAIVLIDEGIRLAKKRGFPGTAADWKDEKLSLYQLMKNREKIIELAEDLFLTGRDRLKYYHILKNIISTEKWADYLDDLLCKSTKQKSEKIPGNVFASIYIEEKYWDRLMDYVEKNLQIGAWYGTPQDYEVYLKPQYPERMLALYQTQIVNYAKENMGRDHYKYIAEVLKNMKTYPGGNEIVDTLLAHFRSVYAKRRAMMEELMKV